MRRGLAALGVAVLVLATLAGARPVDDARAAPVCVKHAKRVVKHVKRHGKAKRVVRIRHFRTCRKAPSGTAAVPTPAAPTPSEPAATAEPAPPKTPIPPDEGPAPVPEPEANALGVVAKEEGERKSYTLSRDVVRAGSLLVQLRNEGQDPHDIDLQRLGPNEEPLGEVVQVPTTEPGAQTTQTVAVEPGRYRMWCDLFHHADEGMRATITVE